MTSQMKNTTTFTEEYVYNDGDKIYRKTKNLAGDIDGLYILSLLGNRYVWQRTEMNSLARGEWETPVGIDQLSYAVSDTDGTANRPIMTIYRVCGNGDQGSLTHTLTYGNDLACKWRPVPNEFNIRMFNLDVAFKPLRDIPMYIDLTQEYVLEQPYDFLGDFQDNPLDGWPSCDTGISEGWNEPFNEEMVGLTTQELNLDDIVENLDDLDDPGESEDLRAYNHYLGNDASDNDDNDDDDDDNDDEGGNEDGDEW